MDVVTRVFVIAMAVATVSLSGALGAWPWLLASDALVLVLLALLVRADAANPLVSVVSLWYPLLLVSVYYGQLGLMGMAVPRLHDRVVQSWEASLFGGQPSLTWHARMSAPLVAWVLHTAYLAHYAIIIGVPLWLWIRAGRAASERAVFAIALTFYLCFLWYAIFPVAGPDYVFPRATGPESAVLPARVVRAVLEAGSAFGTAFPSSHVAASWCAVLAAFRDARRLAICLAPVAVLLAAGTVYGQYHYAVDALAGAAVSVLAFLLAEAIRPRLVPRPA